MRSGPKKEVNGIFFNLPAEQESSPTRLSVTDLGVGALLQACAVIVMGEGAGCFVLDLCVLGCPSQEQNTGALCLGVIMRWKEK